MEDPNAGQQDQKGQQGQVNVQQVKDTVNELLQKLQATDDPKEARELSARLNDEVAKLP